MFQTFGLVCDKEESLLLSKSATKQHGPFLFLSFSPSPLSFFLSRSAIFGVSPILRLFPTGFLSLFLEPAPGARVTRHSLISCDAHGLQQVQKSYPPSAGPFRARGPGASFYLWPDAGSAESSSVLKTYSARAGSGRLWGCWRAPDVRLCVGLL